MCFQFYLQKACVYGQRGLAQDWQASTEAFWIGRASVSGHFSLPMGTLVVEEGSASDEQEQAGRAGFSHTHTSQPLVLRVDLRVLQRKNSSCARRNFSQFLSVNFWMKPCAGRQHQRGSFFNKLSILHHEQARWVWRVGYGLHVRTCMHVRVRLRVCDQRKIR